MNQEISRPQASSKKISTSNDFELAYLRHQYFRRVKYNPTEQEMQPYMYIVQHLTKNTFYTYFNLFKAVGMYHEDVLNIGRVHLVSFLGLYSLEQMKSKKKQWLIDFNLDHEVDPEKKDLVQKNRANFTMFFKQRMEDLVRVCRQKVRNIKGQPSEEYAVFYGTPKPPKHPTMLLKGHEEFGYKKLDFSIFKSIRKKATVNRDATIFEFNGTWYVAIALEQKSLELEDLVGSDSNPYENRHNTQSDELYRYSPIKGPKWSLDVDGHPLTQEEDESKYFRKLFSKKSDYRKRVTLQNFIAKNKNIMQYEEEVGTAKRLLKSLGGWIR
jgi:hypothetical protein